MPTKKTAPKKAAVKTPKSAAKPPKPAADKVPKPAQQKAAQPKSESSLMIAGAKFLKVPFFVDLKKDDLSGKQKLPEKPTACSRPKVNGALDSKNLVELLSQQLEFENRTYFEGCEGQICVKCNINNVDQKYYVDKSLGYCTDCATLLGLGQSKEGVFSDAQMELMRRSMEKSKDIESEDDIESALGEMDLELELEEEALFAEEDPAEFNT
ncbi:MAG: hypothetical protein LBC87_05555 [Fibromonadaceae bacterium]|jgi:hypothetical protein|nr:hypothetical protein [Fibromonadaceae bacterium]